jgi:CelD/BcsL family acetyltransferase involved in cellulose biosynthesis
VVRDEENVRSLAPEWDELTVRAGRALMTPAWLLAWWGHAAPAGAQLRVITVRDGAELVGVAPLWCKPSRGRTTRYAFLGSGTSLRGQPVARPGAEDDVAGALAGAFSALDPAAGMVMFDGAPAAWPERLSASWGAWRACRFTVPAPYVDLEAPAFDDWWQGKSRNFRQQVGRNIRALQQAGAVFRFSQTQEEVARDLKAFAELHYGRWKGKGGSGVLTPEVEAMLLDAGRGMLAGRRLRVWCIDVDGRSISVSVFVAAGPKIVYWLGGFDEAWQRVQPGLTGLVTALEAVWADGYRIMDLGGGAQPYKYRIADGEEDLHWDALVPPGIRSWPARAELLPAMARRAVVSRIPPEAKERIKRRLAAVPAIRRGPPRR